MKTITKIAVGIVAVSGLTLASIGSATAYPAGTPMTLTLQKTAYAAGASNVRVKASHVRPGCIVNFSYDNQNLTRDDAGDYDENEAVAAGSGNTPYAALYAPRVAGDYSLIAQTESYCTPTADDRSSTTVRVGKAVTVTINYNTAVKKALTVTGTVKYGATAITGQSLKVALVKTSNGAVVKTLTVKSTATGYTAKFTGLTVAAYQARVTIAPNPVNFLDVTGGTITTTRLARVAR